MNTLAFLPNLGWPELLIIGVVMLLLFGRRLPEVGRSLGQGIVSFKRGLKEVEDEVKVDADRAWEGDTPPHTPDMLDEGDPGEGAWKSKAPASESAGGS